MTTPRSVGCLDHMHAALLPSCVAGPDLTGSSRADCINEEIAKIDPVSAAFERGLQITF